MAFCPPQKVNRSRLGRSPGSEGQGASTSRRCACGGFPFPGSCRVVVRSRVLTHSGGTAPDSHRTSLLCPSWAPRQGRDLYHETINEEFSERTRFVRAVITLRSAQPRVA